MTLKPITITIDPTQLSDLFFNYEHPEYDKVIAEGNKQKTVANNVVVLNNLTSNFAEELRYAVIRDAVDFLATLGAIEISSDDLADDFLKRL